MKNIPKGIVLGLVGPPGIGKGYVTRTLRSEDEQIGFIYKVTTRGSRDIDREEGVMSGLNHNFFQDPANLVIAEHRPFSDDRVYGWLLNGVDKETQEGRSFIFDPNVEFLQVFKERLGKKLHLIGMVADEDYVRRNLLIRMGENCESAKDIETRVNMGRTYMREMREVHEMGLLDDLIVLSENNRDKIVELVSDRTWEIQSRKEGNMNFRERR